MRHTVLCSTWKPAIACCVVYIEAWRRHPAAVSTQNGNAPPSSPTPAEATQRHGTSATSVNHGCSIVIVDSRPGRRCKRRCLFGDGQPAVIPDLYAGGRRGSSSERANVFNAGPSPSIPADDTHPANAPGQGIFLGRYGAATGIAQVLAIIYVGVTVSDMITFYVGVALRHGFLKSLKNSLFRDAATVERAERAVQRWSRAIGLIQRFSLGFRGPICLFAGFLGIKPSVFGAGVAVGAFGTMALQITAGYFLRHTNAYLAALALVTWPNAVGHVVGPVLTAFGVWKASKPHRPADAAPT